MCISNINVATEFVTVLSQYVSDAVYERDFFSFGATAPSGPGPHSRGF